MDCVCNNCGREYSYKRTLGGTRSVCNTCHTNKRRHKLKLKMVEYMGGACITCGYKRCFGALTFHHINDNEKEFTISGAECRSWKVLVKELKKCVLLCANCHQEYHHKCTEYCNTKKQIFKETDYFFPESCPISFYTHDGRSKQPMYNKKYGSRKDYNKARVKQNLSNNKDKIDLILNSDINFSKLGWATKVAHLIKIKHSQAASRWVQRNMPEFYKEKCYKRKSCKIL